MNKSEMKIPKTYDEQLDILIARGLESPDREYGYRVLRHTNYYRLSGYFLSFLMDDHNFKPGTTLADVYSLYVFDEKLRHLLFDVIEPIEIRLRSELAYILSTTHSTPLAYMEPSICDEKKTDCFARHLSNHYEEVAKSIKQSFVKHNLNKYGGMPIWAAVELWSFGHLSSYLDTLNLEDKTQIAASFNTDSSRIGGWFHNLCTVRNICAHSGRLYNRDILEGVKLYSDDACLIGTKRRLIETLIVLKRIYKNEDRWFVFMDHLYSLVKSHEKVVDTSLLGLSNHWYFTLTGQRKDETCQATPT